MTERYDEMGAEDDAIAQRIRAALEPTADSVRRVAEQALGGTLGRRWRLATVLLGVAGVLALLIAVGVAVSRRTAFLGTTSAVPASRISSIGRLVVAEDGEGEVWISGSSAQGAEAQPGARMTIVLKEVSQ